MLESNPNLLGVFGGSWFYDPGLESLSPHSRTSNGHPAPTAPGCFALQPRRVAFRSALMKSMRRREAYELGTYRPQSYFMVWPRRPMLEWARAATRLDWRPDRKIMRPNTGSIG